MFCKGWVRIVLLWMIESWISVLEEVDRIVVGVRLRGGLVCSVVREVLIVLLFRG